MVFPATLNVIGIRCQSKLENRKKGNQEISPLTVTEHLELNVVIAAQKHAIL